MELFSQSQKWFDERVIKGLQNYQIFDETSQVRSEVQVITDNIKRIQLNEYWTPSKVMSIVMANKITIHKYRKVKFNDQDWSIIDGRVEVDTSEMTRGNGVAIIRVQTKLIGA